jgi:hypothetical protein
LAPAGVLEEGQTVTARVVGGATVGDGDAGAEEGAVDRPGVTGWVVNTDACVWVSVIALGTVEAEGIAAAVGQGDVLGTVDRPDDALLEAGIPDRSAGTLNADGIVGVPECTQVIDVGGTSSAVGRQMSPIHALTALVSRREKSVDLIGQAVLNQGSADRPVTQASGVGIASHTDGVHGGVGETLGDGVDARAVNRRKPEAQDALPTQQVNIISDAVWDDCDALVADEFQADVTENAL